MASRKQAVSTWLEGRSQAVAEVARFGHWSVRRAFSRERLLLVLLLLAAIMATPWLIYQFDRLGWIWAGLTAAAVLAYGLVLLVSYLGLRMQRRDEAVVQRFSRELEDLDRRISSMIDAKTGAARDQATVKLRGELAQAAELINRRSVMSEARVVEISRRMDVASAQAVDLAERTAGRFDDMAERLGAQAANLNRKLSATILDQDSMARQLEELAQADASLRAEIQSQRHDFEAAVSELRAAGPALQGAFDQLRAQIDTRFGPEIEQRLDDWRRRLDNEIADAVQRGRVEDAMAAQERERLLREDLVAIHTEVDRLSRKTEEARTGSEGALKALREDVLGKISADRSELQAEVESIKQGADLRRAAILKEAVQASRAEVETGLGDALKTVPSRGQVSEEIQKAIADAGTKAEVAHALKVAREARDAAGGVRKTVQDELAAGLEQLAKTAPSREDIAQDINRAMAKAATKGEYEFALKVARQAEAKATEAAGRGLSADAVKRIETTAESAAKTSAANAAAMRKMSGSNAALVRPFDRQLSPESMARFEQHWLKTFGLNMSRTALAYMAHKIALLEDRGQGRIAAPIETIIMRQLALRSLPQRGRLEVLEIGTLFGLGASVLYNFQGARSTGMHLTLLDPLEGYYEAGGADPITGVEVSEATVRKNLAALDVPRSDYRLIKERSASVSAIKAASDRLYDFVLIDGDHSTAGVAADFENYGPLVRPGGMIIFDDYGSEHWPGIQPYVDEVVRADPNWVWIGADYRTAILTKKADGLTARIAKPSPPRSRKAPSGKPPKASGSAAAVKPRRSGR